MRMQRSRAMLDAAWPEGCLPRPRSWKPKGRLVLRLLPGVAITARQQASDEYKGRE
jgi:hypothetical protein